MMRVVEVMAPGNRVRYVVIDGEGNVVEPIVRFLKHLDACGRARNTLRTYARMLTLYFRYLEQEGLDWCHPTLDSMAAFVSWLKSPFASTRVRPLTLRGQARSSRTINLALTALTSFYEYMRRTGTLSADLREQTITHVPERARGYKGFLYGIAADSPLEKNILSQPVPRRTRPKTIPKEQVQQLMDACDNQRDRLLIWMLYETGMRIGEALALWVQDVLVDDLHIVVRDRGELVNGAEIKTPASLRRIDVSRELINEIVAYIGRWHTADITTNHVFLTKQGQRAGQPLVYDAVQSLFRRLARKTGIVISPHTLRHSILTALAQEGWRPELLQEKAGHASFQHTYQLYVHPSQNELRQEWERTREHVRVGVGAGE